MHKELYLANEMFHKHIKNDNIITFINALDIVNNENVSQHLFN